MLRAQFTNRLKGYVARDADNDSATNSFQIKKDEIEIMLLRLSVEILTTTTFQDQGDSDDEQKHAFKELISAAAESWHEYFRNAIDLSSNDNSVPEIRNMLSKILDRNSDAIRRLESIWNGNSENTEFCIFGSSPEVIQKSLEALLKIAPPPKQSSSLSTDSDYKVGTLKRIAEQHVDNWFHAKDSHSAFCSFRGAHVALHYAGDPHFETL